MSGDPVSIDDKTQLPSTLVRTDRVAIGRANKLYRVDVQNLPSRYGARVPFVPPDLTDFGTWVNQSTGLIAERDDGIRMYVPSVLGQTGLISRVRTMPGGAWDVSCALLRGWSFQNQVSGGMTLRESATGKQVVYGFGLPNSSQTHIQRYSGFATFSSNLNNDPDTNVQFQFFRALKNGSNIEFYHSPDGVCWTFQYSEALTASFTTAPDQWGIYMEPNGQTVILQMQMDMLHWKE